MTMSVAHPGATFQSKNQASEVPGRVIPTMHTTSAVTRVYEGAALKQLVPSMSQDSEGVSLEIEFGFDQTRTISAADLDTHGNGWSQMRWTGSRSPGMRHTVLLPGRRRPLLRFIRARKDRSETHQVGRNFIPYATPVSRWSESDSSFRVSVTAMTV
jgi:hypothetical protein